MGKCYIINLRIPTYAGSISSQLYVDKIRTGFLTWAPTVKGYIPIGEGPSAIHWETRSLSALRALRDVVGEKYYSTLSLLWGQETNRHGEPTEVRGDNVTFIKSLGARPFFFFLSIHRSDFFHSQNA
jgi:hypothetical protein